jgi:hypothetical protein
VTKLSIKDAMAFQELQRQVAVLVEEQAAQAGRLTALEAAESAPPVRPGGRAMRRASNDGGIVM